MSTIDNLKQELDSLGVQYRKNATESNLKHLLSKHRAQQPKEDNVDQNEVEGDPVVSYVKNDLESCEEIKAELLPSEELGQETQDVVTDFTPKTPEQIDQLITKLYAEFGNKKVGNPSEVEVSHIKESFKNYNPEDVVITVSTTNEINELITIKDLSEDSTVTVTRKEAMLDLESDVRESVILDQAIEQFNPNPHTDKPTFGYKKTDFDSDKIVIKTNVLKGFVEQLTQAANRGYELAGETNAVNVLDTPYRVKLVKDEPVVIELMQPEVKIKIKVYKQSDFIKEILRIIKLGGKINSVANIKMLSGLYVFEAIVDSNYELRKNIDFYAGKI